MMHALTIGVVMAACCARIAHAQELPSARLRMVVRDSGPAWHPVKRIPLVGSTIDLHRIGTRDTMMLVTDASGSATFSLSPGRYDRRVRFIRHVMRRDTLTLAAGEIRQDSVALEGYVSCLGQCPLQGTALRDFEAAQRRVLAARRNWTCQTHGPEIRREREAWRELVADTAFKLGLTPAQRQTVPRLVTDRATCRRIASVLANMNRLNTTSPLVFSVGGLYLVNEPGELGLIITHAFVFLTGFIAQ